MALGNMHGYPIFDKNALEVAPCILRSFQGGMMLPVMGNLMWGGNTADRQHVPCEK